MAAVLLTTLVLLPLVLAKDATYKLHHRVYHPAAPQVPFTERGLLTVADFDHVAFAPSSSFSQDLNSFAAVLQDLDINLDGALYQVALERESDTTEAHWDLSSVKMCHLDQATSESIFLHATADSTHAPKPFALDYFISPVPHNGACLKLPKSKPKKSKTPASREQLAPLLTFAANSDRLNTTVIIKAPRLPPLPELRTPPPLTPEGAPVLPVPEKSFLQKYWMYMAAVLVAIVFAGGPDEEQPRRGGGE
ncbi:hypothetical protein BD779DRAFT_1492003 [Infundibulicybe gibba]|nr:hypothetical protein BD779DRAFT_1492003 [Infundibulicybe gibba]